jgi:hypothetical protein
MKKFITLVLFTALVTVFGCSKGGMAYTTASRAAKNDAMFFEADAMETANQYAAIEEMDGGGGSNSPSSYSTERKLVKRAYITVRVESLESTDSSVSDLMNKYGAYAASTDIEENSRRYTLRVPAQGYDAFLGEVGGIGRIVRRSENTEDVTLHYYDLESRLTTKRELLVTYQSYLGKAKNIEEILSVEARIAELQNDIERTGTQFRNLANTVEYATIELYLIGPVTSTSYKVATFGERIKKLFSGFGGFLSTVGVIITGIVIYGIPALIILAFLVWVLFGRIGLMKKLWRLITAQPSVADKKEGD